MRLWLAAAGYEAPGIVWRSRSRVGYKGCWMLMSGYGDCMRLSEIRSEEIRPDLIQS